MEYVKLRIFYRNNNILCRVVFEKHFVFCKAHPLQKEQEVFQYYNKIPWTKPSRYLSSSHWFLFSKTATGLPVHHSSRLNRRTFLKTSFLKRTLFWKQNINCHTIPDSSIPLDIDYSNRFELCAEVYTLPTSPALRSHDQWDPNPNLFLPLHVLTLTVIPEGVRLPPCPNRTKHSPSLSSRCSPAFITLGLDRTSSDWVTAHTVSSGCTYHEYK